MSNYGKKTSSHDFYNKDGVFNIFDEQNRSRSSHSATTQHSYENTNMIFSAGGNLCFNNTNFSSTNVAGSSYRCCAGMSILSSSRTGLSP